MNAPQEYVISIQFKENLKEATDKIRRFVDSCLDPHVASSIENAQFKEQSKGVRINFESGQETY